MTAKQRIIARILEILELMKVASTVKEVRRVNSVSTDVKQVPSLHLVVGPEANREDEEDTRGYVLEFGFTIRVTVSDGKDPEGAADKLIGPIQTAMESDVQLGGLVTKIVYQGDDPWASEVTKPQAGNMVTYLVQYRRQRAKPETTY